MILNRLEQLSEEVIISGINMVLDNAKELIKDGDILLKEKRFPRAYTLYQFAIEEIGKSRLLYALLIAIKTGEKIDYKDYNREFTNHIRKSKGAIVFEIAALMLLFKNEKNEEKRTNIKDAYNELLDEERNVEELNNNKNFSLYVSTIDNSFVTPEILISEEMAHKLRQNALIRLRTSTPFHEMILKNLEILTEKIKEIKDKPDYLYDADFAELLLSEK